MPYSFSGHDLRGKEFLELSRGRSLCLIRCHLEKTMALSTRSLHSQILFRHKPFEAALRVTYFPSQRRYRIPSGTASRPKRPQQSITKHLDAFVATMWAGTWVNSRQAAATTTTSPWRMHSSADVPNSMGPPNICRALFITEGRGSYTTTGKPPHTSECANCNP